MVDSADIDNLSIDKKEEDEEDVVTPWNVESISDTGIDYDKLISTYKMTCQQYVFYFCF